jgi:hypothetical protein
MRYGGVMVNGIFDNIVDSIQSELASYAFVGREVIVPWLQRLLVKLPRKVAHEQGERGPCEVAHVANGAKSRCAGQASIRCAACRRRSCLPHAFVSCQADALCWECVAAQVSARGGHQPHDPRQQQAPPPAVKRGPANSEIEEALMSLKIERGASRDEMKRSYRALLAKLHPDRPGTPAAKAKRESQFKKVRAAFDLLTGPGGPYHEPS